MRKFSSKPQRDGFLGMLYQPDQNRFPGKAVIVVGGGDGMFSFTDSVAERLAREGMTTLALAYWNKPGLRDTFTEIPLEYAAKAASFLLSKGIKKVGMWGISAGAEYTLLCGSFFPELFSALVAVSPCAAVIQGFQMCNRTHLFPKPVDASPFTYKGKPLAYVKTVDRSKECIRQSLRRRTVYFKPGYAHNFERTTEENVIRAENCSGPILLLAADQDDMWESARSCREILHRLKDKNYPHPVEYYHYPFGSHMLFPDCNPLKGIFRMEREHPKEYDESCRNSFQKTLEFFRKW